jgi:hypothetical protein
MGIHSQEFAFFSFFLLCGFFLGGILFKLFIQSDDYLQGNRVFLRTFRVKDDNDQISPGNRHSETETVAEEAKVHNAIVD